MKKREAKWNTILNQYLREKKLYCYYELKQTITDKFIFSKIEKHQNESLIAMENNGLVWKFSDEDQRQKPCDGLFGPPLPSYLVIKFLDGFYFIRYEQIATMQQMGHKSINRDTAQAISQHIIKLKI